ncbi:hypothetical protein ACIRQF_18010 [Streptomyces sp. NPDC101191]|uniref:hypothetical protein n=1 Tax=Streptomyces sp. NPDC101191 TaxID=3366126 RepID=UPI0038206E73
MSTALRLVRRLLTAVLLSAAISVGPVALAPLTVLLPRAAAASLTLDPDTGPPGRYVTLHGSFPACGAASVSFDGAGVGGAVYDPDTQELDGSLTVPQDASPGPHPVTVTCAPEGTSASASFTVTGGPDGGTTTTDPPPAEDPALTLTPDHGSIGDVIAVQGSGFAVCSPRTVDLYIVDGPGIATGLPVSERGHFSYRETVPPNTTPDTYTFRAACSGDASRYADAPLTVTPTGGGTDTGGTDTGGTDTGGTDTGGTDTGGTDTGGTDTGGTDTGGTDTGGTDTGGTDTGGTDTGGTDTGGTDTGGTDTGGTDTGGTDTGGTGTGGDSGGGGGGGSATPVGVVVGSTSGAALALAAAAAAYFGRLHRGPRWVHKHVRAALRPATGATQLTEDRASGEPPTHTTRLDPHPDPGRQTLHEEER